MLIETRRLMKLLVMPVALGGLILGTVHCGSDQISSAPLAVPQQPGATPSTAPAMVAVTIPAGATGMGPAAFGQNPLTVPVGTTIEWTNSDTPPHSVTSTTGVFDSGTLSTGQKFSFEFKTPGTFHYICTIHGAASMSGSIVVTNASATPGASATPSAAASTTPASAATPTPTASAGSMPGMPYSLEVEDQPTS